MAASMASVLRPGDVLATAELTAARLDGEVYRVDESFAPVDEVDGSALRATALLHLAGSRRVIAELDSALWIYGLRAHPPAIHRVCVVRSDRMKFAPSPRFLVREMTHGPSDVEQVAGMRVTVPERILFDLAVLGGAGVAEDAVALIARSPSCAEGCLARLRQARNLPGKNAALARMAKWTNQPALTRYTS